MPFRTPLTPSSDVVRIDTQPNGNDATELYLPVNSCYLFGAIDVAPGNPTNTVDLTPGAKVTVGLLSTPTFNATHVAVSSVLFGVTGTEASPTASTQTDLNGDGRKDLKLTFSTGQTGIDSTTTLAMLSATDPRTRTTFYESGRRDADQRLRRDPEPMSGTELRPLSDIHIARRTVGRPAAGQIRRFGETRVQLFMVPA